jgi:glucokinase
MKYNKLNLGIDVGGSSIKFGLFDAEHLIEKGQIPTPQSNPNDVINAINSIILNNKSKIDKVGIGFPSVVSKDYFVHTAPNINGFVNINLKQNIINIFPELEIKIDNDANSAALAELKFGSGKNLKNMIYITLGSGIGGAIIINKSIYYGDTNGAGEIGYTNFKFDEKPNSIINRTGIFEEYLGRKQFTEYFNLTYNQNLNSPKEIFDLAENNNPEAIEAFNYYGRLLGIGIASAMNFLDIHNVIIGGGLIKAHKYIKPSIIQSIEQKKLPHINQNIQIAKYLDDTGIYGAMALVG